MSKFELIYLWVGKYKNIENDGFNFSSRFKCEYKNDTKELTVDENKKYVSIFPDNINVTAIVGENGSGKSSLLESLIEIFSKSISNDDDYSKYILIYKYQEKYHYLRKQIKEDINMVDKDKNTINWISENPNDRLFDWHSELLGLIIQNEVNKNIYLESEQIFIEEVQNKDKNKIKKYIVVNSLFDSKFKKESNKFFNVKNIEIKIKWRNLFNSKEEGNKYEIEELAEIETKFNDAKENFKNKKYKDTFLNIIDLCEMKIKKLKRSGFFEFVHFTEDPYISNQFRYEKLYNCFSHIEENQDIKSVHQLVINDLNKYDNFTFKIEELDLKIIDFIFDLPEYIFDIQLKDENKTFEDLSFGERQLLTQLNFIQFYINKKQYIQYEGIDFYVDEDNQKHEIEDNIKKKVKSMIVLIDELEIGLHPNWQKNSINYIFDFLQNIKDIDFNFIVTSHSPFMLSDIPKENVIFLKNGKQVQPFKKDEQTFGANIHTLLSHGFFMDRGLMGEFAKEKMQSIINYHNEIKEKEITKDIKIEYKEHKQKYFWNIQSIIGDEYLKQVFKNHLIEIEKIILGNDEAKQNEIERLQAQIKLLKGEDA
ncbi:AAA family ATPase [Aliarcobacter butzleri]